MFELRSKEHQKHKDTRNQSEFGACENQSGKQRQNSLNSLIPKRKWREVHALRQLKWYQSRLKQDWPQSKAELQGVPSKTFQFSTLRSTQDELDWLKARLATSDIEWKGLLNNVEKRLNEQQQVNCVYPYCEAVASPNQSVKSLLAWIIRAESSSPESLDSTIEKIRRERMRALIWQLREAAANNRLKESYLCCKAAAKLDKIGTAEAVFRLAAPPLHHCAWIVRQTGGPLWLLDCLVKELCRRGLYQQALLILRVAISRRSAASEPIVDDLSLLAWLHFQLRQFEQAQRIFKLVLVRLEAEQVPPLDKLAAVRTSIGLAYACRFRPKKALSYCDYSARSGLRPLCLGRVLGHLYVYLRNSPSLEVAKALQRMKSAPLVALFQCLTGWEYDKSALADYSELVQVFEAKPESTAVLSGLEPFHGNRVKQLCLAYCCLHFGLFDRAQSIVAKVQPGSGWEQCLHNYLWRRLCNEEEAAAYTQKALDTGLVDALPFEAIYAVNLTMFVNKNLPAAARLTKTGLSGVDCLDDAWWHATFCLQALALSGIPALNFERHVFGKARLVRFLKWRNEQYWRTPAVIWIHGEVLQFYARKCLGIDFLRRTSIIKVFTTSTDNCHFLAVLRLSGLIKLYLKASRYFSFALGRTSLLKHATQVYERIPKEYVELRILADLMLAIVSRERHTIDDYYALRRDLCHAFLSAGSFEQGIEAMSQVTVDLVSFKRPSAEISNLFGRELLIETTLTWGASHLHPSKFKRPRDFNDLLAKTLLHLIKLNHQDQPQVKAKRLYLIAETKLNNLCPMLYLPFLQEAKACCDPATPLYAVLSKAIEDRVRSGVQPLC